MHVGKLPLQPVLKWQVCWHRGPCCHNRPGWMAWLIVKTLKALGSYYLSTCFFPVFFQSFLGETYQNPCYTRAKDCCESKTCHDRWLKPTYVVRRKCGASCRVVKMSVTRKFTLGCATRRHTILPTKFSWSHQMSTKWRPTHGFWGSKKCYTLSR